MAQHRPEERITLDQMLMLAEQLTPEEQEKLVDELKLAWLRRAIAEGEQSIRQHGTGDAEEVFSEVISQLERKKTTQ